MTLKGKTAIITGATQGIGRQIAYRLANEGISLGLLARTEEDLKELQKELQAKGIKVIIAPGDLSNRKEVEGAIAKLIQALDRVDILINNAGVAKFGEFLTMPREEWEYVLKVNLLGSYYVTRLVYAHMKELGQGDIITLASTAGEKGAVSTSAQTASKAALLGMTESLALEARPHNIRVTTLVPSTVATEKTIAQGFVKAKDQHRLLPEDLASYIVATLQLNRRSWLKRASLWSTNPS